MKKLLIIFLFCLFLFSCVYTKVVCEDVVSGSVVTLKNSQGYSISLVTTSKCAEIKGHYGYNHNVKKINFESLNK